jgi:hypothetical protein
VKFTADNIDYVPGKTQAADLWTSLLTKLPGWHVKPGVKLTDAKGRPVWGVEYLQAHNQDGIVINLCNYRNNAESVKLLMGGKAVKAVDVLTGKSVSGVIKLQPLDVRLLKIEHVGGK